MTFKYCSFIIPNETLSKNSFMKNIVNPIYAEIGKRIFEARNGKMTQEQLADKISLKRTSITNIEKGKQQLLVHTLIDIAQKLEVEVNSLIPKASEKESIQVKNDKIQIKTDKYPKKSMNWVNSALSKIEQQK